MDYPTRGGIEINLLFAKEVWYNYLSNLGFRCFTVFFGMRFTGFSAFSAFY